MSYSDFIKSLSSRGIPPPRRIAVNRDVPQGPRYVVSNVPHQRAQVRSLRRHGYGSEDGRVAIQPHMSTSHGHESDRSSCHSNGRRRTSRGYDSDVCCHGNGFNGRQSSYNHDSLNSQSNQCRTINGPIREEDTALACDPNAKFAPDPRMSSSANGNVPRRSSRHRTYEPIEL
jgi:hypothetical protein